MSIAMSTRNPSNVKIGITSTEFQIHKTQHPQFDSVKRKLIDFTEHKLIKCAESARDYQQQLELIALLDNYKEGKAAVAWRDGQPVFISISKEK